MTEAKSKAGAVEEDTLVESFQQPAEMMAQGCQAVIKRQCGNHVERLDRSNRQIYNPLM